MTCMIFVNLPVTDLARSVSFYEAVGARKNPKFSDDTAAMLTFSDTIHAMLLTHARYADFTSKRIADAHETSQVLIAISAGSREEVDATIERARAAGATLDPIPRQDLGLMYSRSFEDPDGHIWEVVWMDPAAAEQGAAAFENAWS